ncbi:MAG: protein kinase [Deltaproteobacteria bacterium]|jgi:serine/threonine protein kinase|nr:protein kinase [Deltaproteobacteria bacterium]MBW2532972.1 protein kinase [Deltaproteobacteria bacterium]
MTSDPFEGCADYDLVRPATGPEALESFVVRDSRRGEEVLVRLLPRHLLSDDESLAELREETGALHELNHPNVAKVLEVGRTADGRVYVATELVGRPLREELRTWDGALPVLRVLELVSGALYGLEAAHELGMVHGGLSLDSLCLCAGKGRAQSERVVQLLDFGLARTLARHGVELAAGNGRELAADSDDRADLRMDLFCVGALLYELLAGRSAFEQSHGSPGGRGRKGRTLEPPSRYSKSQETGPELDSVVLRSLESDPDDRYQSAAAFRAALDRVATLLRQVSLPGSLRFSDGGRQDGALGHAESPTPPRGEPNVPRFSKPPVGVDGPDESDAVPLSVADREAIAGSPFVLKAALAAAVIVALAVVAYLVT